MSLVNDAAEEAPACPSPTSRSSAEPVQTPTVENLLTPVWRKPRVLGFFHRQTSALMKHLNFPMGDV